MGAVTRYNDQKLNLASVSTEVLALNGTPNVLISLLTAAFKSGVVIINNRAAFSIFWTLAPSASVTPTLTTGTGIELPAASYVTLDNIGGMAIWMIAGTTQSAGSGTRVTSAYRV
jgi:hypothetical protein